MTYLFIYKKPFTNSVFLELKKKKKYIYIYIYSNEYLKGF